MPKTKIERYNTTVFWTEYPDDSPERDIVMRQNKITVTTTEPMSEKQKREFKKRAKAPSIKYVVMQ